VTDFADIRIGVLALQGDYGRHEHQLRLLGVVPVEVRLHEHLADLDGLIIPGGESTTMDHLIDKYNLREGLERFCRNRPVWGTCAGMILLSKKIEDNQAGVKSLGVIDIDVRRVGYGRQVYSTQDEIEVDLGGGPGELTVAFIRAPVVTRVGNGVTVLGEHQGEPVLVAQANALAASFHTELGEDTRMLRYFLERFVLPSRRR
jgi:5'-phosphate synthase pdxT subunit